MSALACFLAQSGSFQEAMELYEKVMSLEPSKTSAKCNFATMLLSVGEDGEGGAGAQCGEGRAAMRAEELLKEALAVDPTSFSANALLAQTLAGRR